MSSYQRGNTVSLNNSSHHGDPKGFVRRPLQSINVNSAKKSRGGAKEPKDKIVLTKHLISTTITKPTAAPVTEKSTGTSNSEMASQHHHRSRSSLNQMEYNRIFAPLSLEGDSQPLSLEDSQTLSFEGSTPLNSEDDRPIFRQRTTESSSFFSEEMEDMLTLKRANPVFDEESDDESIFGSPSKRQRTNNCDAMQTITWSDQLQEDDDLEEFVRSQ